MHLMTRKILTKYVFCYQWLFIILGNQLFNPKYLSDYKDHSFLWLKTMNYARLKAP